MLHPPLPSLLRRRICRDEDPAKKSKQRRPQHEQDPVPAESPVALEEREAVEETCYRAEAGDGLGEDPFAVGVGVGLVGVVEVYAVEAGDDEGEDELEEADC